MGLDLNSGQSFLLVEISVPRTKGLNVSSPIFIFISTFGIIGSSMFSKWLSTSWFIVMYLSRYYLPWSTDEKRPPTLIPNNIVRNMDQHFIHFIVIYSSVEFGRRGFRESTLFHPNVFPFLIAKLVMLGIIIMIIIMLGIWWSNITWWLWGYMREGDFYKNINYFVLRIPNFFLENENGKFCFKRL